MNVHLDFRLKIVCVYLSKYINWNSIMCMNTLVIQKSYLIHSMTEIIEMLGEIEYILMDDYTTAKEMVGIISDN